MDKAKVLIIEDDDLVRNQMKWALAAHYDVLQAEDRPSALEAFKASRPGVVTLDLGLPPSPGDVREGFLALEEMLKLDPLVKIVVITGQGEKANALEAVGKGAFDFFCKPVNLEDLRFVLGRAQYLYSLEAEHREVLQNLQARSLEGMLGCSPCMRTVFEQIRKVAPAEAPVLVVGESGTGKELAARAIHNLSGRARGPFVTINCGAIPENLLESELFGHEKGSFTGAHVQRAGKFELAQGGTLFLDEIGDLSPTLQVKLLRFLQDQIIERVGGRREITVDARVLCATNVDLREAMAQKRFRDDLYYRISVVVISMPPLRDRNGDIVLLAQALLQRMGQEQNKTISLSAKALEAIESHLWPGNVRELENKLKRAVIMVEGRQIHAKDLGLGGERPEMEMMGLNEAREALEREMIEKAIARNRGNLTRCAEELKISRSTLYELIERLGIARK